MASKSKKEKLVEELFTCRDIDLIGGVANLVMEDKFSVKDALKYLGELKFKLSNGFTLTPFNDRLLNIMIGYTASNKNIISRITFGGNIEYTLEELVEQFGAYRVAYSPRDEMTAFFFNKLPKELNAAELNFSHYDLVYDEKTERIFELKKGERHEVAPADIKFKHFTMLF